MAILHYWEFQKRALSFHLSLLILVKLLQQLLNLKPRIFSTYSTSNIVALSILTSYSTLIASDIFNEGNGILTFDKVIKVNPYSTIMLLSDTNCALVKVVNQIQHHHMFLLTWDNSNL